MGLWTGLAARVIPFIKAGAMKALPKIRTAATALSGGMTGATGRLRSKLGGTTVGQQISKIYKARKSVSTSGLINAGITGAALGGPILGAIGGAVAGGKGMRIKSAIFGGAIGSVVKKLSGGGGMSTTPGPKGTTEGGTGGGGIIKNEQTSIPGAAATRRVSAPRRRRTTTTRRRTTRRGRRRSSISRRMARVRSFRRKGRSRRRETWGPKHRSVRRHKGGRSGHGRHGKVSFTTKDGRKVSFTSHKR